MKTLALFFSIIVLSSGACLAQTSSFTYQGKLGDGGSPANGSYQFECKLFDGSGVVGDSGSQIGATQTVVAAVQNGIFTMQLDFGAASFAAGQNRWLEIGVRLNGSGGAYTVFDPRQQINSVPYAVRSLSAGTATTADNATKLAGVTAGNYVQTSDSRLNDARIPTAGSANYIQNTTAQTSADFNINGTGTANVLNAAIQYNIGGKRVLSNAGNFSLYAGVDAAPNSTGEFNSFFGFSSGKSNTASCCNSFFGAFSGYADTGDNNSFFGSAAGGANTQDGSANTIVGAQAGNSFTHGSRNTILGYNAGWTNTSEDNNTFIGYQANALGGSGITNATALGNQAVVTRSNSVVLGSINGVGSGTADTNVGIGTSAPLFRFHVRTGTDQDLVVRPGADFGSTTGIGLQSINDANSAYQPLDLEGSKVTMNVGSGGNVGIGTADPTFKLEVVDAANTGLRVQTNVAGGTVASFGGNGVFQIDASGAAGGRLKITETKLVSIPQPSGLILRSPNNTCWAINVSDTGVLSTTSVSCP